MSESTHFGIVRQRVRENESRESDVAEEFDGETEDDDGGAIVRDELDLEPLELQPEPLEVQRGDWTSLYPNIMSTWVPCEPDRWVPPQLTPEEEKEMEYAAAKRQRAAQAHLEMCRRVYYMTK